MYIVFIKHNAIANLIDYNVNITFIYFGKPEKFM